MLVAALLPACANASEFLSLRQFGAADGLPQMTVLAIARDRAGYLYVGTQDGLARYDGQRFQRIPLRPGLHDVVSELLADGDGLWAGSSENGLFHITADGRVQSALAENGERLPAIEALSLSRDGKALWVGTPGGLYRCTKLRCALEPDTADLPISTLLEGRGPDGDCLWVGTNTVGVLRFDHVGDGRLQRSAQVLGKAQGLPNPVIRALAHFGPSDAKGAPPLWIGTGRGVAKVANGGVQAFDPDNGYPVGGAMAFAVSRNAAGGDELYVASYGGGLVRFDADGHFVLLGLDNGLPERFLYSLLALDNGAGQPGQLWIGTSAAGLLRIDPGRWHSLDERHILPARSVVSVGELLWPDGRRRVWAGTLSGAVVQDDSGGWKYLLPRPWWDSVVYSAVVDPKGRLWVGTLDGLLLVEGERAREFTADADGLPGVAVQELLWRGGGDGELWIGSNHGLARWRDGNIEPVIKHDARFASTGIRAMIDLADRDHPEVALATSTGLFFTDGKRVREVPAGCLPHKELINLARADRDTLWAATRRGAVRISLQGEQMSCHPLQLSGDGPKTVYAMALDRLGRLYLFGYDGSHRIDNPDAVSQPGVALRHTHFGMDDGLPSLEFNRDAVIDAEGRLWAANNAGLVAYEPDQLPAVPATAPLRVQAFVGARPLKLGEALPSQHDELRFVPRLLSFSAEHRIRYRSRLVGLDRSGSGWTPIGERPFNRLPPGDYRFVVEARDAFGRVVTAPAMKFSVLHPWWQHPVSLVAGMIGLLLVGLLLGRWRARALAVRAATLETEVMQRTEALASANRNLEQASNTDPMTGAWNRRHFYAGIDPLLADREVHGLWLLLVDIDHFKQINDRHGHAAGDDVLIEIARRLGKVIGDDGMVVRWGGEEFLLACDARDHASSVCRLVMESVSGLPIDSDGTVIPVTCSIGVTRIQSSAESVAEHIDSIVARADAAMYCAKNEGRNRAVLAAWREGTLAFETVA